MLNICSRAQTVHRVAMPMHRAAHYHLPSNGAVWPYTLADRYHATSYAEDDILDFDLGYDLDDYMVPTSRYEQESIFSRRVVDAAIVSR